MSFRFHGLISKMMVKPVVDCLENRVFRCDPVKMAVHSSPSYHRKEGMHLFRNLLLLRQLSKKTGVTDFETCDEDAADSGRKEVFRGFEVFPTVKGVGGDDGRWMNEED